MTRSFSKAVLLIIFLLSLSSAFASSGITLGGMANDAMGPIEILRHLFNAASVIVGASFLISAWFRYLRHRRNPQESPLGTVLVFAILGVALIAMPFLYQLSHQAAIQSGAEAAPF